ncbi:MAG: hypothetical protein KFB95_04465 [Simkaniaceae bacterium]|nr:MAG: hypothetical protein KFB95_04465 [Simkaniaceae bacterium]
MTPEDIKKMYPPFISKKILEEGEDEKHEKITDFLQLIRTTWVISNEDYQERFWVRQELPMRGDNFMETTMTFNQDLEGVLEAVEAGHVKIAKKQYEMLIKLYNLIDKFDGDPDTPPDPGYGENDKEIVADPRWDKIRNFAKEVYEELTIEA